MEKTYTILPNRVKAALIDRIVLAPFMYRISLLAISGNEKKAALHDLLLKSVVLEEEEKETIVFELRAE